MEDEFIIFHMPQTMLNILNIYRDILKLLYTQDYNIDILCNRESYIKNRYSKQILIFNCINFFRFPCIYTCTLKCIAYQKKQFQKEVLKFLFVLWRYMILRISMRFARLFVPIYGRNDPLTFDLFNVERGPRSNF